MNIFLASEKGGSDSAENAGKIPSDSCMLFLPTLDVWLGVQHLPHPMILTNRFQDHRIAEWVIIFEAWVKLLGGSSNNDTNNE